MRQQALTNNETSIGEEGVGDKTISNNSDKKHSGSTSLTHLPRAELQRSSSWGAATSLPLPFRDRALESAAVASRYHGRRQKWRYFPVYFFGVKETADIVDRAAGRSLLGEVDYADPQCPLDGRQFRSANDRPECSSPSAFVAWQQGEPQLTDSWRLDSSAWVLHQKAK